MELTAAEEEAGGDEEKSRAGTLHRSHNPKGTAETDVFGQDTTGKNTKPHAEVP